VTVLPRRGKVEQTGDDMEAHVGGLDSVNCKEVIVRGGVFQTRRSWCFDSNSRNPLKRVCSFATDEQRRHEWCRSVLEEEQSDGCDCDAERIALAEASTEKAYGDLVTAREGQAATSQELGVHGSILTSKGSLITKRSTTANLYL